MRSTRFPAAWFSRIPWAAIGRVALAGLLATLRGAGVVATWSGRALYRHRAIVAGVAARAMLVVSLLMVVDAGRTVFDVTTELDVDGTLTSFAIGFGLCAATVVVAPARRVRWAAIVLGTLHGALALLLWSAAAPG